MKKLNKVLLVDDDPASNFLSKMTIVENDQTTLVDEVKNGREALEYLLSVDACPELILLDLNMPVIDGIEFLEIYKDYVKCKDYSKIVILTSSQRSNDKAQALNSGLVSDFIEKPLTEDTFRLLIEKHFIE